MQQPTSPSSLAGQTVLVSSFGRPTLSLGAGKSTPTISATQSRCVVLFAAVLMLIGLGRLSAANISGKASVKPVASIRMAPERMRMTVDSLISAGAYDSWVMNSKANAPADASKTTAQAYRPSAFAPTSIEDGQSLPSLEYVALMCAKSVAAAAPLRIQLLPVVFFDSASSEIAKRYALEPLSAGTSNAQMRTLHDAYLRVLDALATQLATSKDTVVLHGYEERNSGGEECRLARSRAERIKNYLVHQRGISPFRVRISNSNSNCLPPDMTLAGGKINTPEYRRVEILTTSNDPFPISLEVSSKAPFASALTNTSILMFDARSEYILRSQRAKLTAFIKELPANTELSIAGHAEVLAGTERSTPLGAQRALGVAALITKARPDCRIAMMNLNPSRRAPLGLPTVDLPEIRYMSRSVIVRHNATGSNAGEVLAYNQILQELETAIAKRITSITDYR